MKCAVCHRKQASGLWSNLGIQTPWSKIPLLRKKRIQKFKERGDSRYNYQNEPGKACFQHDMVYGDLTDLLRRTTYDQVLCDKASYIHVNPKCDAYQHGLASVVYKFFDKKCVATFTGTRTGLNSKNQ